MSDLVTFGETMLRLSPPGNERLETTDELEFRAAGAESNVAVAAERLGAVSTWMSKLPDSPLGRRVDNGLRGYGIDTEVVWSEDGRQGTYYLEHGGQPRGTNVIYDRENAAVTTASAEEFDLSVVRDARAFYTSGITPALSDTLRDTTANLLQVAKKAGTTTAFDLNYRSKLWSTEAARQTVTKLFQLVDVLVIPLRDAERVLDYEGSASELAHHLASKYEFQTVLVTQGEHGSVAWHDNVVHDQNAYEADTVDAIGTGDAFVGGFLGRRLSGDDVPQALKYAAATASLKRTIPGDVAAVTKTEVEAVIGDELNQISR
ncbi:bifunctional 2-dehydro-3-deoxygluconokinase/2-dehydro-3-deoxygalactonokinase [Halostella salina]|uniref:bifunctional 2-dehydro-3-deoxygluconokinase/2-dehydro-3- deoxygalactonokinase n=1 Tax=Halostella salina TaxID=1547897 RepID=UPI000EF76DDB|nr:bifunctional 2-dehydro-3-deoxygluconokinase/2-dehydro-3-deoxygalactonokinase [Halostella salina]